MFYHFKVTEEIHGFWAECLEIQECRTQADSIEELQKNSFEALNLFLEEPSDSKIVFPLPDKSLDLEKSYLKVEVEPEVGFAVLLRYYRSLHNWTQKETATREKIKS